MRRLLVALALVLAAAPAFAQMTGPGVLPGVRPITAGGTFTSPLFGPVGCTAIPYSFTGRTTTGLCSPAAAALSQYAGATEVTRATTTFFKSFLPVYGPNGAVGAPTFTWTSDPDTGFYQFSSSGDVALALNGTAYWRLAEDSGGGIPAIQLAANAWMSWGSSGVSSRDLGFQRLGAGLLGVMNDATHGVMHDVTTDGTDYCKSRAGADTCILKASAISVTTGGSTTISTGVGSVKMSTGNAATNTAWIPITYAGTTYYVPAWTTNAP